MAGRGCRLLGLAGVTLALTARCAALTAAQNVTTIRPSSTADKNRAPYGSRVAAVLAPCLVALAIVVALALAMAVAKLRKRRQTEGRYAPQQLESPGGRSPPVELQISSLNTLTARVERLV